MVSSAMLLFHGSPRTATPYVSVTQLWVLYVNTEKCKKFIKIIDAKKFVEIFVDLLPNMPKYGKTKL